jgi:hypothetical protein
MSKATLLNVREAAQYRGITERQVQRLASAGLFPVADVGARNALFFKKSEIRYAPVSLKG